MSGLLEAPKIEIKGSTVDGVTGVSLEFLMTFEDDGSPGELIVEDSEDELVPLFLLTLSLCC